MSRGFRWWRRVLRRRGWLAVSYAVVLAAILFLLARPFSPEAVPALASPPGSRSVLADAPGLDTVFISILLGGRQAAVEAIASPRAPIWKWVLRSSLPPCGSGRDARDEAGWGDIFREGFYLLSGVRWGDPLSWLSSPLTGLAAPSPGPEGYVALPPAPGTGRPELPPSLRGQMLVGLYCTHARESYLPAIPGARRPEDAHTTDSSVNMLRVAEELARTLSEDYGIGVVMSRQVHDREGKLGAYLRSHETASQLLATYPQVRFLFDIHRDSVRRDATVASVGGREAARVMLVLGSRAQVGSQWDKNKALADRIAAVMEGKYPGLLRRLLVADARYNQHLSPGALLFEIGGVDNTLEEALYTARLLADVLATVIGEDMSTGR